MIPFIWKEESVDVVPDLTVAFTWLGKDLLRVVLSGNEVGMNYILSPAANGQPFSEWSAGMKIVAYTHY